MSFKPLISSPIAIVQLIENVTGSCSLRHEDSRSYLDVLKLEVGCAMHACGKWGAVPTTAGSVVRSKPLGTNFTALFRDQKYQNIPSIVRSPHFSAFLITINTHHRCKAKVRNMAAMRPGLGWSRACKTPQVSSCGHPQASTKEEHISAEQVAK